MKKKTFYAKVKEIDIDVWDSLKVLLNEGQAYDFGITSVDDVVLIYEQNWEKKELVVNADLTHDLVERWEIGITKDIYQKYGIKNGDTVGIKISKSDPISVEAIKKKLLWEKLTENEVKSLMRDMTDGKINDILTTYYAACSFTYPSDEEELFWTAKYSAEMWDKIEFNQDTAVKYCIWWIPGNETTMAIVPILWSLGISSPKTFSKAITSPASTWECVEVLMDIEFSVDEMKQITYDVWSCLAWWRVLKFAPANDKIIKVSYPLQTEAYSKVVVSIMAKIYAWGTKYCLIDLPVGEYGKIKDLDTAKRIRKHFEYIWDRLWMNMKVEITEANAPVGKWIWAVMQVREVLRILQNKNNYSTDLREKIIKLSADLIELVGYEKWNDAVQIVEKQIVSGKAWEYMKSLINKQNNIHHKEPDYQNISYLWVVDSEELPLWKFTKKIYADKSWVVKKIDVKLLKDVCRKLWAPVDKQSGVYLNKQIWDKVEKWDILCEIFSGDEERLGQGYKKFFEWKLFIV